MRTIHKEAHLIERIGWLRAAVLGANDGLIWTSSLIVGVAAATTAQHEILVAGIAGLVAGPWGIRTSSLWYAIVGNTAPAGSYAAARKSNLRWLRAPATNFTKYQKPRLTTRRGFCVRRAHGQNPRKIASERKRNATASAPRDHDPLHHRADRLHPLIAQLWIAQQALMLDWPAP